MNHYSNSLEHIKEELNLLDLRLKAAVYLFKGPSISEDHIDLAGIVISDREIQRILRNADDIKEDFSGGKYRRKKRQTTKSEESTEEKQASNYQIENLLTMIDALEKNISVRKRLSEENKIHLSLDHVSKILSLSPFEYCALVICLAPEIDIKYEKLYAYLQDDITKKRPTLELILRIQTGKFEERIKMRDFIVNSAFFKYNIIEYTDSQQNILSRPLKLDDKVVNYILGINNVDYVLEGSIEVYIPNRIKELKTKYENLVTNIPSFGCLKTKVINYLKAHFRSNYDSQVKRETKTSCICLLGKDNCGRKTLVKSALEELEFASPLLILDLDAAKSLSSSLDEIFKALIIEAILLNASVYLDNFNALLTEENEIRNIRILKKVFWHLKQIPNKQLILIAGEDGTENDSRFLFHHSYFPNNTNLLQMEIPNLTIEDRILLWTFFLEKSGLELQGDKEEIKQISSKFNFTVGQIKNAINTLTNTTKSEKSGPLQNKILPKDLHKACFSNQTKD